MATQVQRRKGTTVQHSTFTGASAELTVDTTKNTVVVHNGATAGGFPLAKDSEVVHLTGAETVAGVKTFSSTIAGSITGNAGTVTNGVYTAGDQTVAGVKTLSSNPILSAGTANGVTYLNGSKVLTSGSALVFDGTNFTLGNSVSASPFVFGVSGANSGARQVGILAFKTAAVSAQKFIDVNVTAGFDNYYDIRFYTDAGTGTPSEQMRLTSTGLGIGTSSPGARLEIGGASTGPTMLFGNTGSSGTRIAATLAFRSTAVGAQKFIESNITAGFDNFYDLRFFTDAGSGNPQERARIDSSGNFMVGATSTLGRVTIVQGATSNADTLILKSPNAAGAGSQAGIRFLRDTNAVLAQILADTNTGSLITSVNGAERARIDSSGNSIQSAPATAPTLATNGTMVFNLTSNTNLRVSVRGSDGVTRTANLTLA